MYISYLNGYIHITFITIFCFLYSNVNIIRNIIQIEKDHDNAQGFFPTILGVMRQDLMLTTFNLQFTKLVWHSYTKHCKRITYKTFDPNIMSYIY